MKITLEAFSPAEGIGIVRTGAKLLLIRPPYNLRNSPLLADDSVRDAILKHDFFESRKEFNSWQELIDFLNDQVVKVRRDLGLEIPDSIDAREVIEVIPVSVLETFLDRIELELIPHRMFDRAEHLLLAFLTSDVIAAKPGLAQRAARLLQLSRDKKEASEIGITALAYRDARFVSLERHGQIDKIARVAQAIKKRRCIFSPAS